MSQQVSSSPQSHHVNNQSEQVMRATVEELISQVESLGNKFDESSEVHYIEEAIALDREALAMCTPSHPKRIYCFGRLSRDLWARYEQLGDMNDNEEALCLQRQALGICLPGNEERPKVLCSLAISLQTRYGQLGRIEDLSDAIDLHKEVLLLCPPGHPDRSYSLCNLATCLSDRYDQLGGVDDLNEAIDLAREDLKLHPPNSPERPTSLTNLGCHLFERYELLERVEDLSEAVDLHREALQFHPPGHTSRSLCLNNLASSLSSRYWELGGVGDISEALDLQREALKLCPPGHPLRPLSLGNLAACLSDRYKILGAVEDLNEAIDLRREALMHCPLGHPDHSGRLMNLASCLFDRYEKLHSQDDREEMFSLYNDLTYTGQSASADDLSAAKAWVEKARRFNHPTTVLAYQTALQLLVQHVTALPSLPQNLATLRKQSSSLAIDAFMACLHNQSPTSAVELLEQGRSLSWNQLARLRSPLDDVIASGSEGRSLANDYSHLTSRIQDALNSPGKDQHDRVCQLNVKLASTVSKIRELPGSSHFLLPLLFSGLRRAASGGPVIIVNASQFSCDALVIVVDRDPIHVPLSVAKQDIRHLVSNLGKLTERAKRDEVSKDMQVFLRDLWDQVVSPISDCLCSTLTYPPQSRVWWCPTTEFSLLPLHAAAPYRKGQKGFSDLYISSYTPTLSALIRARHSTSSTSAPHPKRVAAVGQANASGTNKLHSVGEELANLKQQLGSLTEFTSIEGQDTTISRVTEEMGRNEWVHLACHGLPDKSHPFESAFALQDGRLTIQWISQLDLKNAEFAYLSACHTTVGDEQNPDEALHLAAAMQFAGFRSVIGTMWAVDDSQTNKITSVFYSHMVDDAGRLDHTRAAYAMWKTTRSVRVPLDQRILYVHIGA